MREDERTALRSVALKAGFVLTEQGGAAALELLGEIRPSAFDGVALMRVVAIGATHLAFEHRMVMRQIEFRVDLQMALETGRRRSAWIDDQLAVAAAFHVQASRSMTRFAADVFGVGAFRLQARMGRRRESFRDCFVTGGAIFRADKFSARDARRRKDGAARLKIGARK